MISSFYKYDSSKVFWCENKYCYSIYIAEIFNTITGISYLIASYLIHQNLNKITNSNIYSNYSNVSNNKKIAYNIIIVGYLIGFFTIYFHGTMSYLGQILDEFSIFLLILIYDYENFNYFKLRVILGLLILVMGQNYNRLFLLSYGLYRSQFLVKSYFKENDVNLKKIFRFSFYSLFIGKIFWLIDIFLCDYIYFSLHWIWHIFSSISFYLISNFIIIKINNFKFKFNCLKVTLI